MTAKLKNTGLILLLSLTFFSLQAFAQVVMIEPAQPKWGTNLTITYNPKAEGAKLTGADDIYVSCGVFFPDRIEYFAVKMERAGEVFKYQMPVRQNMGAVQCRFITLNEWDQKTTASTMIYHPDGVAARGAYQSRVGARQYKEMTSQELALYPDNYAVYREKWFWASNMDKNNFAALIKEDMDLIAQQTKSEPADLLYSLSYGYLVLKLEEKGREAIKKLAQQSPTSPFLASALGNYEYQVFAQQIKGEGPKEIEALKRELIRKHPETELARENAELLARDKDFQLTPLEAVCRKWMEEKPDNPTPYLALADGYNIRQQKMDEASSLIEKAINLLLQGKARLHGDFAGSMSQIWLPRAYIVSAEIHLQQQNYARALSAIKAAQALEKNTTSRSYVLEGEIWQKLSNPTRAENAYFEAWQRGAKNVEEPLKAIYQKKNGSLTGFDEYVKSKRAAMASAVSGRKLPPPFNVTSIDGEKLDLAALRGKVVVLNFWFIGCAPCRVEMPGLNQLVSEFKGKDVVFIAFATDAAEELQTFLKEKSFNYRIVPAASKTAEAYEVNAYPTHVIIGKDGQIISRLTGGSDTRHDDLRPLIERALSGQ